MKRRITVEQLNELTEEQKNKLRDWWIPKDGDYYTYEHKNIIKGEFVLYDDGEYQEYSVEDKIVWGYSFGNSSTGYIMYPLLDISQMIDLDGEYWYDQLFTTYGQNYEVECIYKKDELCDALWSLIKKRL